MQVLSIPTLDLCEAPHARWFGPFEGNGRTFHYPTQRRQPGRLQVSTVEPSSHSPIIRRVTGTTVDNLDLRVGNAPHVTLSPGSTVRLSGYSGKFWVRLLPGDGAIADASENVVTLQGLRWQRARKDSGGEPFDKLFVPAPDYVNTGLTTLGANFNDNDRLMSGLDEQWETQLYILQDDEALVSPREETAEDTVLPAFPRATGAALTDATTDRGAVRNVSLAANSRAPILAPHRFLTAYELKQYQSAVLRWAVLPQGLAAANRLATGQVPALLRSARFDGNSYVREHWPMGQTYNNDWPCFASQCFGSPSALARLTRPGAYGVAPNTAYGPFDVLTGSYAAVVYAEWLLTKREEKVGVLDAGFDSGDNALGAIFTGVGEWATVWVPRTAGLLANHSMRVTAGTGTTGALASALVNAATTLSSGFTNWSLTTIGSTSYTINTGTSRERGAGFGSVSTGAGPWAIDFVKVTVG